MAIVAVCGCRRSLGTGKPLSFVRAMEIDRASLTTLWVTSLGLPYLVFAIHNSFRRKWLTFFRALVAVGVGWLFLIAYATAADAINRALASTPAEIEALNNGDGAKLAFATVLGWVLPTIIVGASWVIHGLVLPRIALTHYSTGHCAMKPCSRPVN